MRLKRKCFVLICIFFVIFSLNFSITNATGSFFYSVRLQSNVTFSQGLTSYERDAANYTLASDNSRFYARELFIKNDDSFFYLAIRVEINLTDIDKGFAILLDTNHDKSIAEDVKILNRSGNLLSDGYFTKFSPDINYQSEAFFDGKVSDFTYIDGSVQRLYEFKIPFTSSSPTKDLSIYDPDSFLIGLDFVLIFQTNVVSWNSGLQTKINSNANNFQTFILAGPGRYLIPDFEPIGVTQAPVATQTQTQTQFTITESDDLRENFAQEGGGVSGFEIIGTLLSLGLLGTFIISMRRKKK